MSAQIEQLTHFLHAEMNPEFFNGISQMITELMICLPDFHERLDRELLEYVYQNISQRRCDLKSYSHLSKHKVDDFLNFKRHGKKENKTTNTGALFHSFLDTLGNTCNKLPNETIPISGEKHFVTFKSIFDQCGLGSAGYAPKAARLTLINAGCIELVGKDKLKFISKSPKALTSDTDTIRQISNIVKRYIASNVYNRNAKDHTEFRLFDRSTTSDLVPEPLQQECLNELRELHTNTHMKARAIIEKYEVANAPKTHAIGWHVFHFATEL